MIARASKLFLPTLRDPPADADAVSHKLLVRGGYIRQVGAGIWTYLPLGWKVHERITGIIRGDIDEIFRLKDRYGRDYVLPMTHEETVTFHAREIQSYRQLPQILYHFSIKERDAPRSRGGLIRMREFIMKDAYSFDRDDEGLDRSFRAHEQAYLRIFERCGLEVHAAVAESGMMGGSASLDFLAPAGAGENLLVTCERGDYVADSEIARGVPRPPEFPERLEAPADVDTPGVTTIEALA